MESGFERVRPGIAEFGEWRGDQWFPIDPDFKGGPAGGSDARDVEAVVGRQLFDVGDMNRVRRGDHRGGGFGKETEERMCHERWVLLNDGADREWEGTLG